MTWFKVDDTLATHPKARRAGLEAMGLWVVAGAFAGQHLTDGFVPEWYVETWPGGSDLAQRLVTAGLWTPAEQDGETGWEFHQWSQRQPTKAEVEAERERNRARQAAWRAARRNGVTDTVTNAVTDAVSHRGSNGAPTRPDPTRPSMSGADAPAPPKRAPRGHRLPTDWQPSESDVAFARDQGLDPRTVAAAFRDHWHGKAGKDATKVDWSAAWRNWCRNEIKYRGNGNVRSLPRAANGFDINSVPIHERWRYQ